MNPKHFADEFEFLRNKLEKIAALIIQKSYEEATFMIGCLHSVCHNHYAGLSKLHNMMHEERPNPPQEEKKDEPTV